MMVDNYNCPECGGTTFILDKKTNTAHRCRCYPRYLFMLGLKTSGIGARFLDKTFENFRAENEVLARIKGKAMSYSENYDKGQGTQPSILFLGNVGTGKTHLAVSVAQVLLGKGIRVKYMGYRTEITKLKQIVVDYAAYTEEMESLKQSECLLIDDMFKGKVTEADVNYCYEIIDYRYTNGLPIIVTSEKTVKELLEIDEAIASRMFEMAADNIITIGDIGNRRLKR